MSSSNEPEKFIRQEAAGAQNALFVIRDQVTFALTGAPLDAFRAFLSNDPVDKFLILTDYCFDKSYPNDVIVFTVMKGAELLPTASELAALAADLKNVRDLDDAAITFLRDSRFFTFVFVLEKKAKLHATRVLMIKSIDESIKLQSTWVNASTHEEAIKRFKLLRQEAESKGFNQLLFDRMLLASTLAATVSALIVQYNPLPVPAIGWFSDRDAIVEKGTALASHLYSTILNDYSIDMRLPDVHTVGVIDHTNPQLAGKAAWFDPLIRIADYFARPLAMIDYNAIVPGEKTKGPSMKYTKLLCGVFADNPNLVVMRLLGKILPNQTSLVTFSNTPPPAANGSAS